MTELTYQGYHLEASAQVLASGQWAPRALVWRAEPDGERQWVIPPPKPQAFGTSDEAEAFALQLAKAWVDEHG